MFIYIFFYKLIIILKAYMSPTPQAWVALDDEDLAAQDRDMMAGHFVRTCTSVGFTEGRLGLAKSLLWAQLEASAAAAVRSPPCGMADKLSGADFLSTICCDV